MLVVTNSETTGGYDRDAFLYAQTPVGSREVFDGTRLLDGVEVPFVCLDPRERAAFYIASVGYEFAKGLSVVDNLPPETAASLSDLDNTIDRLVLPVGDDCAAERLVLVAGVWLIGNNPRQQEGVHGLIGSCVNELRTRRILPIPEHQD